MAAPLTPDQFLEVLRQSDLVGESELTRCETVAEETATAEQLAERLVGEGLLTSFHTSNLLRGRYRGFFVGKYKLLELLGAGGMGQVYLASHKAMRRLVALKILRIRPGANPAILPRFQREARAMAALDHPNIVHAYDCDQDADVHYIVLEFVDGVSLSDLVKRNGPLSVGRACNYLRQAGLGLHHAHEMGIIHRDIKPGNILLAKDGVVKILDMGLARLFEEDEDNLTLDHNHGRALGTADYLAPEQAENSHEADARADIYSLGGTLYYLLTGKAPFHQGTTAQKLIWHRTRDPQPIREQRPEIPEEIDQLVARMMAKKPEERFATVDEIVDALAAFDTGIVGLAENEAPERSRAVQLALQAANRNRSSVHIRRVVSATGTAPLRKEAAPVFPGPPESPQPAPERKTRRQGDTPPAGTPIPGDTDLGLPKRRTVQTEVQTPVPTPERRLPAWLPQLNPQPVPDQTGYRRWWAILLVMGMGLVGLAVGFAWPGLAERLKSQAILTPAQAGMHLQQRETVEFRVRSTSVNKTPPGGLYLHSEANWKQRNTFSALLSEDVLTALKKERGEDFLTQIKDRLIRVTGKIEQVGEGTGKGQRLQILIDDPLQLALQGE